jgi:hypothetical protein
MADGNPLDQERSMARYTVLSVALPLLIPGTGSAQNAPPALNEAIETAATECASFEGGVLAVPQGAPRPVDLTGDGSVWVLDFADLACSTMVSFACGTGGCQMLFAVGDHVTERLAAGWTVADFGARSVILLDVHGSRCGGINPTPCVEALVWDGEAGQFMTVAAETGG